jgi:hypothetical protein
MEAGEWSLHEEVEEGVESMLGDGDGSREIGPWMKRNKREWNQCWEVVMEAGEWPLDEEEHEGVESMLGDGDGSRRVVLA